MSKTIYSRPPIVSGNPDDSWVFNADEPYVTPAGFTTDEASTGTGSLHVEPITNSTSNHAKFILRYVPDSEISLLDLDDFSIDFLIDDAGTSYDVNQFYINLYTLTPDSDDGGWYDCRFDYVSTSGSISSWTSLRFDGATTATATGDKIGGACPSSYDQMPMGSKVLFISVNLGDTSGNDSGVGGYFDNAVMTLDGNTTSWDFEPPNGAGKASFGFTAKYRKGANVPSGNTQFTFKSGGLDFHSSSYDWLVVNQGDSNAQFKGEGSINGEGSYHFMLWAGDDDAGDTFRIKIWEEVNGTEAVVYDNGMDQPIEGGQIVVHSPKGR